MNINPLRKSNLSGQHFFEQPAAFSNGVKFRSSILMKIALILLLPAPAFLCAETPLLLDHCFRAAMKRSETLAGQQELVVQAEEHYRQAWGSIMPSVNGSYTYFRQDSSGGNGTGGTSSSSTEQTLKITADQPLFRGFRDFGAIAADRSFITAQEQARDWAGMQLYMDVAQGFYTLLAVQKDAQLLDNEIGIYQKRINELQERIAIGRSRVTEVLAVKSAQAILKAQREQVYGQLDAAKEVLAFLTGLDQNTPLDDTDAVPAKLEPLDSYQSMLDARPDIIAAKKNVEYFKSNVSVAGGERLPSADLTGDYYLQGKNLQQNGIWDAQIAVTLPVFAGGIISSDIKIAESQERQSEQQLSRVERLAVEDIRTFHHNLQADLAQLTALQDAFNIAEENYKANVKDYELGLVTNLDVLQALTSYQDTARSLEKIRYQSKIDYNKLEAAAAKRLNLMKRSKQQ